MNISWRLSVAVWLTAAMVIVTGCGPAGNTQAPMVTTPASPAPAARPVPLPDRFPEVFPPAPEGARLLSTEVVEQALLSQDFRTELGTMVHTTVRYGHPRGGGSARVLAHYRAALPAAGWHIVADEPVDPDRDRPRPEAWPAHRLRVDGHGYHSIAVTIDYDAIATTRIRVSEGDQSRRPSTHPPVVGLPDWYRQLPAPPEGSRRSQIRITAGAGEPTRYLIEYSDAHLPDSRRDRAAALAGQYRHALPGAGWTIRREQDRTERDRSGGVIIRRSITLAIAGHGAVGEVHIGEVTSAAGQWLDATLAILIETDR